MRELIEGLIESEPYKGRGAETRLAKALDMSQSAVSQIRSGGGVRPDTAAKVAQLAGVDPVELLGGSYVGVKVNDRYPGLATCLDYHRGRWSPPTIAAARAGAWPDDVEPKEWAARLDALERTIKVVTRGDGKRGDVT